MKQEHNKCHWTDCICPYPNHPCFKEKEEDLRYACSAYNNHEGKKMNQGGTRKLGKDIEDINWDVKVIIYKDTKTKETAYEVKDRNDDYIVNEAGITPPNIVREVLLTLLSFVQSIIQGTNDPRNEG